MIVHFYITNKNRNLQIFAYTDHMLEALTKEFYGIIVLLHSGINVDIVDLIGSKLQKYYILSDAIYNTQKIVPNLYSRNL